MQSFTITPRNSEINSGNHVGNNVLPVWFEEARLSFLDDVAQLIAPDVRLGWLVRHAAYSYERELRYRGDVEIRSSVQNIGNTSLTLYQEAWQNGARAVTATTTLVLVNRDTMGKTAVTDAAREFLQSLA